MSPRCRLVVEGGVVATGDGRILPDAVLVVDDDRITEVREDGSRPAPTPADWIVDADGRLVTPGLVNGYWRLPAGFEAALASLVEGLQSGLTGAIAGVPAEGAEALARFRGRLGLDVVWAIDVSAEAPEAALEAAAKVRASGEMAALGLGAAATWADAALRRVLDAADAESLPIVVDAAAGDAELQRVWEAHRCRPVERLRRVGALGERTIAVHGTLVDSDEIDTLARTGTFLVVCPRTAGRLGWIAPVARLRDRGAAVALGTADAGADLLAELDVLEARWSERTSGTRRGIAEVAASGAALLGRLRGAAAGGIAPGALADLVIHRHRPAAPVDGGLWAQAARRVQGADWVVSGGRVVVREGRPLGIDPAAVAAAARGASSDLRGASG